MLHNRLIFVLGLATWFRVSLSDRVALIPPLALRNAGLLKRNAPPIDDSFFDDPGNRRYGDNAPGNRRYGDNGPGNRRYSDNDPGNRRYGDNDPGNSRYGDNDPGNRRYGDNDPGNR